MIVQTVTENFTIKFIMKPTHNEQPQPKTRTRKTNTSSSSTISDSSTNTDSQTTNNNPQSPQTNMNPTFQLMMSAIGKLIISILRFLLAIIFSGFKLVNTICVFFINMIQDILNRLP